MNPTQVISDTNTKLALAVDHFKSSLNSLRTGRAVPSMLDGVMVEAYGVPMPLIQVATVTAPEAQLLQITPFDPSNLQAIAKAIRNNQTLGLNPSDDGRVVRVPIPALNEERRRDLAKQIGQKQEESLVSMRALRHAALDTISEAKKNKEIGEDDSKRFTVQVEEVMSKSHIAVESIAKAKETEIMTV